MRDPSLSWTGVPLRCLIGTLACFVFLNLPYRYAEYAAVTLGAFHDLQPTLDNSEAHRDRLVAGGWPLRYVTLVPQRNQEVHWAAAAWMWRSLAINVMIALATAVVLAWLASRWVQLAAALVGTALLGLVAYGVHQTGRDLAVAKELSRFGVVYRSAVVPAWLPRIVPSYGLQAFSRTRSVMLHDVDQARVAAAVALPTLDSLGLWKRFPSSEQLRPLMLRPTLRQLAVFDAELDASVPQFIAAQGELRNLVLVNCRGLTGGLGELDRLTQLQSFNATNSDLPLASLSKARWTQQLLHMRLSPPPSGSGLLELRNYHRLESLAIRRRSNSPNADLLTLSLETVPNLRVLGLASTQKLALSIVNAPRLQELRIEESDEQASGLYSSSEIGGLWLESLRLVETPSLRKLNCYGLDLRSIEIRAAPNLIELSIDSVFYESPLLVRRLRPSGVENLSTLIAELATCDGPPVLNLSTLPLQGIDLSPLTKNKRIRELKLAETGIDGEQLKSLLSLPRLIALDVRSCPISNRDVADVLQSQPQLRELRVDPEHYRQIEIIDRPELVKFTSLPMPHVCTLRISGSPRLDSELLLGNRVEELLIRDASSLRGIAVNGPVPEDATLQGFRDLQFCALGGLSVDDRLCEDLWQCQKLTHLTLAHAKVSRESLANIRNLQNLNTLILPGCAVDDSVTQSWDELRQLREVDLSQTAISRKTLDLVLSRPNLQRLAINYVDLKKSELRGLIDVAQLIELEVAGIGLEESTLLTLATRGMLDHLDLSDCRLSPEAIRILAEEADSLVFLGIRNCGLGEAEIRSILSARPRIAVDIEGNPVSESFRKHLADSNRLLKRGDRHSFLCRIAQLGQAGAVQQSAVPAAADTIRGRINVHQFAKPRLVSCPTTCSIGPRHGECP